LTNTINKLVLLLKELEKARKTIGEVDEQMAELFEKRMDAVKDVAKYKQKTGKPIDDLQREEQLIRSNSKKINNKEYEKYYLDFLRSNIEISKKYQHRLLDGMKISLSGTKGAFADITARKVFPNALNIPCTDFAMAYKSVENGECDCAFLPLENSFGGDVGAVLDLAYFGNLYINGIYETEIVQNLIGIKGADISEIKTVISHPQALLQCSEFINKNGYTAVEAENTSKAAEIVYEKADKTVAAIGSEDVAKISGLGVIKSHINESNKNTTRFAVFSATANEPSKSHNRFILMFTVKNAAGALSKAISVIGQHRFNLNSLKSRPTKLENWNYYFYVEGEGNINDENGKEMLKELKGCCEDLKVLGSFQKEVVVK